MLSRLSACELMRQHSLYRRLIAIAAHGRLWLKGAPTCIQAYCQCAQALVLVPGHKALFLRCYAMYIAGERSKEQQTSELASSAAAAELTNEVSF